MEFTDINGVTGKVAKGNVLVRHGFANGFFEVCTISHIEGELVYFEPMYGLRSKGFRSVNNLKNNFKDGGYTWSI